MLETSTPVGEAEDLRLTSGKKVKVTSLMCGNIHTALFIMRYKEIEQPRRFPDMHPLRPRILCTEDDLDTRDLLRMLLEVEGFEVVCAENSTQAMSLAMAEKFDLYLLDNWMPDMAGDDLCRNLREFDPKTPILFYSGAAFESDKARAMAAGAQGYIVKPALPQQVTSEISRLIALRE
jgi:CheY-like chemotaxis protein